MKDISNLVETYHKNLPERIRTWLRTERGLSDSIINKYKLGWNGKAISIPINDEHKQWKFFKFRKDPQDTNCDISKYWYSSNSHAELYGVEHLTNPKPSLILCEGEFDRLILQTNGLSAITGTSGVDTFKNEWAEIFNTLPTEIFICLDNDEAGVKGTREMGKCIPCAKIVQIPRIDGIKDVTDFIKAKGIEEFRKLLDQAKTLKEIEEQLRQTQRDINKPLFPELSTDELLDILGVTIKRDEANKLITFLCELSAFTEDSQFNISFNAPSSTGKSYIPIEIASLFPKEDVIEVAYCTPTAFFHDFSEWNKERKSYVLDLSRKIIIFLDQPHNLLLHHLRPFLSHDKRELHLKITDKSQKYGLRTKNIYLKGFSSVIFCTAKLNPDEQESTRFLLLSPETNKEKIREAIYEKIRKETDKQAYMIALDSNPGRQKLKERIKTIKEDCVMDVKILSPEKIQQKFFKRAKNLKPRHTRDIGRVISLIKAFALLNLWHRESEGSVIIASDTDIEQAFIVWNMISESQELNLPPYVYDLYSEVIIPAFEKKGSGVTRHEIRQKHYGVYGRFLSDWQLHKEIVPMLDTSGLITQEQDPNDKRRILISPVNYKGTNGGVENNG